MVLQDRFKKAASARHRKKSAASIPSQSVPARDEVTKSRPQATSESWPDLSHATNDPESPQQGDVDIIDDSHFHHRDVRHIDRYGDKEDTASNEAEKEAGAMHLTPNCSMRRNSRPSIYCIHQQKLICSDNKTNTSGMS